MRRFLLLLIFFISVMPAFSRSVYKVKGNDVIIHLEGIGAKSKLLKIEVWTPSVVKVVSTMNDDFSDEIDLIGERPTAAVKFKATYAQDNIEISTANLIIHVAEDGMVRMLNKKGRKLLVESNRIFTANEDGTYKVEQRFFLNRGEHIYGFGQQDLNTNYNIRGREFDIQQDETNIASPIFYSEKGFAFIWDNYSATHVLDKPSGFTISSEITKDIEYFVVNGPEWNSILEEIKNISGESTMLPKWAYGFHLNPVAYSSKSALSDAVEKYKSLGIPVEDEFVDNSICKKENEVMANKNADMLQNIAAYSVLKPEYEKTIDEANNKRVIIPTHSNFVGIQKYSTYVKAGKVSSCWKSLEAQVQAGITAGFTGQPYWSTTIGGAKNNSECPSENKGELMTRWFQFAALTPVFQGAPSGYEAWDNEGNGIESAIKLRYQLLPYIYTSAHNAVEKHKNLMNSLLFDYQHDDATHDIGQQYMFGPSLLVCPVTKSGVKNMKVHVPAGNNWVDFWNGKLYDGGNDIELEVSEDNIPFFVKQGAILPIQHDSIMEFRVYGGVDADFTLYEDAGNDFGYKNEQFSKITVSYSEKKKTVEIGSVDGEYPEMPKQRWFSVVVVTEENGIGQAEATEPVLVNYVGKKVKLKL